VHPLRHIERQLRNTHDQSRAGLSVERGVL
jgi:hypothetical protein